MAANSVSLSIKGYTACIKALGAEFEYFRCIKPENDSEKCGRKELRILMDQIPEDADEGLDGVVFKLMDGEDQKVLDRILRSLHEQTVQNGSGHPSAAPSYEVNDLFGDGVRF